MVGCTNRQGMTWHDISIAYGSSVSVFCPHHLHITSLTLTEGYDWKNILTGTGTGTGTGISSILG